MDLIKHLDILNFESLQKNISTPPPPHHHYEPNHLKPSLTQKKGELSKNPKTFFRQFSRFCHGLIN